MEEKQLLNAISDLMDEKLQPVKVDIRELKEDAGVLKQDVSGLKEDVGVLKQDVSGLKEDVEKLSEKQVIMEGKMDVMAQNVNNIEFILENKVYHEIHLVAESHFFLKRKLDYIETTLKRHSDIPMKVSYLYYEVQQIKRKMAE